MSVNNTTFLLYIP